MRKNVVELVLVLVLVVVVVMAMVQGEAQARPQVDDGVRVAPTAAATATPETLYIDLAWGQKMYVLCSENSGVTEQPAGEIGAVSFGGESWGVACYPPGTNEREAR